MGNKREQGHKTVLVIVQKGLKKLGIKMDSAITVVNAWTPDMLFEQQILVYSFWFLFSYSISMEPKFWKIM